jgi:hypothetical protein
MRILVCGILAGAASLMVGVIAQAQRPVEKPEIRPSDVYAHLELFMAEIELVRQEIGSAKESRPQIVVQGAEPRHNYFQALSLCRKTQRLCFDLAGDEGDFPPAAPTLVQIRPADVFAAVHAALQTVRRVKSHFGVVQQSQEPAADVGKTPNDVFRLLIDANRQLSLMLDTRPTPTSVYEQLTEAVGTANRLLAHFPDATEVKTPPFERGKTPAEVHHRLTCCTDQVRGIMQKSGLTTLEADWRLEPSQITPGDVYDIVTLLVSELRYLESRLPPSHGPAALTDFPPGRKLPAHNFQRAGLLAGQLEQLQKQAEAQPDWLTSPKGHQ